MTTLLLILLTMMLRESLERLSQQERCIAGLEAQLAEAKIAKEELAKVEENNNSRKMIGQMKDKLTKSEKKRSKEEPKVEVSGGVVGRRGSSSSREFHTGEEDEVVVVSFFSPVFLLSGSFDYLLFNFLPPQSKLGGRRGSSSSREFQHEGSGGEEASILSDSRYFWLIIIFIIVNHYSSSPSSPSSPSSSSSPSSPSLYPATTSEADSEGEVRLPALRQESPPTSVTVTMIIR